MYHIAFGHFTPSTVLFSLQITLNLSSSCSLLRSFTTLPPHFRVKILSFVEYNNPKVQRTNLSSESFVSVYQFIRDLFVVSKKNSSFKSLIYPFCLSKCFGTNNNNSHSVLLGKKELLKSAS